MDPRFQPSSQRKQVLLLVALTLLAWATQTLFTQWARGQERFVPADPRGAVATLELRGEAVVIGSEVTLRQIARWSKQDDTVFAPLASLVVMRLDEREPYRSIGLSELKAILRDAGANLASIHFAGPLSCTVGRSDVRFDEGNALRAWIDARESANPGSRPSRTSAVGGSRASEAPDAVVIGPEASPFKSLRQLLIDDLASRLKLAPESLQVTFKSEDESVLRLSEPHFRFDISPHRASNLGQVAWNVTIVSGDGSRRLTIAARAQAWQQQVVVMQPVSVRQLIRDEDIVERRALVDSLSSDPLLTRPQVVGQQAARELKPGTVLTTRLVEAMPLVKSGQLVTVVASEGAVRVRTVARALDNGAYGQAIRVKNEATRDIVRVTVTGPQQAMVSVAEGAEPMAARSDGPRP
jgi:flagella basal body P-ring formation protein FlgA